MSAIPQITKLNLEEIPKGVIWKAQFHIVSDGLGNPILIPLLIARGTKPGPVVGLTAAVHGNEINGLPVIQRVFQNLHLPSLCGTVVGILVVNVPGFLERKRQFNDDTDLNYKMPGKQNGNRSDVYIHRLLEHLVSKVHYLVDLHTASFGRINSYYVRADMTHPIIHQLALLQNAQIILNHPGNKGTLRHAAVERNIPAITVELRDPHTFQKDIIHESVVGITNILKYLSMQEGTIVPSNEPAVVCHHSYWLYTNHGGLLEVFPPLASFVTKGEPIAQVKDPFGEVLTEYTAPEGGIIIGKSVDPINQTGSRICHLGIIGNRE
ncbi:succinylglutamate desuccinylase/aspartoacylase family protein [Candidatus Woesearchaeota archaeon]|nr:succinylglutamate desuccinylase/aspartoacylase family protein [Candidatus Woesearchaeota archaeon]